MDIDQIKTDLQDTNPQKRMKAVLELRNQDAEVAVPLLIVSMKDKEFLVRSFSAMALGKKQNAESFAALLEMMKFDRDPNVRAEASNSISLFGAIAAPHLTLTFEQDDHWLVRRSILAAVTELDCAEELWQISVLGIAGEDQTVTESSIDCLGNLVHTEKKAQALTKLLSLVDHENWRVRWRTAKALGKFKDAEAKDALMKLKSDENHRVVSAVLESII
ncbi:PBS lyase HEAT-like repeat protein [Xenococcus sp. PCC 7305]|uniref:HEAT repeat domain-containing protein n=1 Tax=Xenococcus sp. PCC 7305 TaxID=102125 RepID=UPI0002AC184C|nr:HEAT repeat domain-containing protein [Xenococcus sp. PCC 7305]ELS02082.1 PBS lyase HEAT-like repeat protein [Xenococcus sp. PCC 7305]